VSAAGGSQIMKVRDHLLDALFVLESGKFPKAKKGYYVGYTGHGNLGDEALRDAIYDLFHPGIVFSETRGKVVRFLEDRRWLHWDVLMLGGGTLILRSQRILNELLLPHFKHYIIFGTGVAQPLFWKNFPDDYGDCNEWIRTLNAFDYIGSIR